MNCIKCGAEIKEPQVFCDHCLGEMEQYPVKPNITVTLPPRNDASSAKKKSRRQKYVKPEDMIRHLKIKLRILWVALIVVLAAFLFVSVMMLDMLKDQEFEYQPGQNYGTMSSTEPT